jgi:PEP-CTERM motif
MRKLSEKSNAIILGAVVSAAASILSQSTSAASPPTNTAGPVQQGQSDGGTGNPALNNPAVTISFSGQTALKSFFISPAVTELEPGTSIVLHDGTNGAPVTYTAPNDPSTTVNLASKSFLAPDKNPGTPTSPSTSDLQVASAVALQWHEEGSIDGFVDLLNDEIGYAQTGNPTTDPLSQEALRTPSSPNPTVINQNVFSAAGSSGGFTLDNSAADQLNQTYNTNVYNQTTGANLLGGQNRVQFAIGEFPTEALAVSGTASPFATPGSAGYGQGNTALKGGTTSQTLTQLGTANSRQQFQPVTAANESSNKIDPNTGSAYTSGPWNTAGAGNITSTAFAVTAVTYSANPGTGLYRIDLGDAQWLQTTGRLQNGALFNVVARTVNTGQRAVFALNTGVDPTWAVGSNDDGNSTSSTAATAQHSIGASLRFDGKTSGSEAATTIAVSRMAVGALSVPEARAVSGGVVRALDVDFNDQTDVNSADDPLTSNKFVRANFNTIVSDGSAANGPHYAATLISHVNTVEAPNPTALLNEEIALNYLPSGSPVSEATDTSFVSAANQATAWSQVSSFDPATAQTDSTPATAAITGIKGDPAGDAAAVISNIVNSDGTAAANLSPSSANNPADGLFNLGFLIPGLLDYTRTADGQAVTPVTLSSSALAEQATVNANYGPNFSTDGSVGANANTTGGTNTTFYGGTGSSNGIAINGNIPITAKDVTSSGGILTVTNASASNGDATAAGGNYLFGNFNQNGVRDYSAVQEAVNAAISLYDVDGAAGGKNSIFTPNGGITNGTAVTVSATPGDSNPGWLQTGTNTKGDLIALGDYNGDGKFDGADLYLFAIGASLADSTSSNTLTATVSTFSDALRNPNAVLRKNAALDYINGQLNQSFANVVPAGATLSPAAFLRQTGRAVLSVGVSTVPAGATDLGTTDPITGFEQFTYDSSGSFAFDKHDVNRDGVVDFNDAILVDNDNGQSYTNLTQSLAVTQQTPVSGAIESLSLVAVQQIDGEPAISTADLTQLNTGLIGTGNTNWYGYNVQKTGTGTINYGRTGGTVIVYSGASFQIGSGTVNVGQSASGAVAGAINPFTDSTSTGVDTSKSVALSVTGGTLNYAARTGTAGDTGLKLYKLSSLSIASGQVDLQNAATPVSANRSLLVVGQLSFPTGSTGTLDLGSNDLIVHGGNLGTITSEIAQGHGSGATTWSGSGITSSSAAASPTTTALGVELNSDGTPTGKLLTSFDGQSVTNTDVLVKYTFVGDADLSGKIDATDYGLIDNGFEKDLTGWRNGDFNYDGVINGDDYTLIDNAFNTQGSVSFAAVGETPAELIATDTLQISTAVPEPSAVALLTIGAAGLIHRRRRRS